MLASPCVKVPELQGQPLSVPTSKLQYWEEAGLEPLSGPKYIRAACICPQDLQQPTDVFLQVKPPHQLSYLEHAHRRHQHVLYKSLLSQASQICKHASCCNAQSMVVSPNLPASLLLTGHNPHAPQDLAASYSAHSLGTHSLLEDSPQQGIITFQASAAPSAAAPARAAGTGSTREEHQTDELEGKPAWLAALRAACEQLQRHLLLHPPDLRCLSAPRCSSRSCSCPCHAAAISPSQQCLSTARI